jgi:hypothetical protein
VHTMFELGGRGRTGEVRGEDGGGWEGERNDSNIVCTYE